MDVKELANDLLNGVVDEAGNKEWNDFSSEYKDNVQSPSLKEDKKDF